MRIQLNDAGSVIPAGHRVRLALSTAYWPMIWPTPANATVTVFGGSLELPVRVPVPTDALLLALPGPEAALPETPTIFRRGDVRIERIDRIGLELGTESKFQYHVEEHDPARAVAELRRTQTMTHGQSASRRGCGCLARAMPSCCRGVHAPWKARSSGFHMTIRVMGLFEVPAVRPKGANGVFSKGVLQIFNRRPRNVPSTFVGFP